MPLSASNFATTFTTNCHTVTRVRRALSIYWLSKLIQLIGKAGCGSGVRGDHSHNLISSLVRNFGPADLGESSVTVSLSANVAS